jgi:hypothetical protein
VNPRSLFTAPASEIGLLHTFGRWIASGVAIFGPALSPQCLGTITMAAPDRAAMTRRPLVFSSRKDKRHDAAWL